jgi:hypothetical protein
MSKKKELYQQLLIIHNNLLKMTCLVTELTAQNTKLTKPYETSTMMLDKDQI